MRLIDADALADEMMKADMPPHDIGGRYQTGFMDARSMVITAPTIDPVKHGKWLYRGVRGRFPICECSVCGNAENADWAILGDNVNYCPHSEIEDKILAIGYTGKEGRIYIGGRLFAVRELAQ